VVNKIMKKLFILIFAIALLGCDSSHREAEAISWVDRSSELRFFIDNEKYEDALQLATDQIELARETYPDSKHLADWCNNLGLVYYHLHQYQKAIEYLGESLRLVSKLGHSNATVHRNLALVYNDLNKLGLAESYVRSALKGYAEDKMVDSSSIAHSKLLLARVLTKKGDMGNSAKLINDVLSYGQQQNDSTFVIGAMSAQVSFYTHFGHHEIALEGLNMLMAYYRRKQQHEKYANALNNIGSLYYLNTNFEKAIEYFDSAASYNYNVFQDSTMIDMYVKNISHVYKVSGDSAMAKKYSDLYNSIKK
jgi:two-component system, sensor histidine kinase PdtaS